MSVIRDIGSRDEDERREIRRKRRRVAKMTDLSTVGLVFPVAMVLGFLAGRALGSLVDAAETGGLIGGAFGLVAGFYNVYRTAVLLRQQSEASAEKEASEEPSQTDDGA